MWVRAFYTLRVSEGCDEQEQWVGRGEEGDIPAAGHSLHTSPALSSAETQQSTMTKCKQQADFIWKQKISVLWGFVCVSDLLLKWMGVRCSQIIDMIYSGEMTEDFMGRGWKANCIRMYLIKLGEFEFTEHEILYNFLICFDTTTNFIDRVVCGWLLCVQNFFGS